MVGQGPLQKKQIGLGFRDGGKGEGGFCPLLFAFFVFVVSRSNISPKVFLGVLECWWGVLVKHNLKIA